MLAETLFFFSIYTNIFPTSLPLGIASDYKISFPHLFVGLLSLKTASLSGGRTNLNHIKSSEIIPFYLQWR